MINKTSGDKSISISSEVAFIQAKVFLQKNIIIKYNRKINLNKW